MRIFLSSTVYDLNDVRGALIYVLSSFPGFVVFASEEPAFPIADSAHRHSYDVCLARVRNSDLVIALVDTRYGGTYENEGTTPVSTTRKEIRVAHEAGIPVWTFVRSTTWEDRNRFKHFLDKQGKKHAQATERETLFAQFKEQFGTPVQTHYVFDLIDEITRFQSSNWIFNQFRTSKDVLTTIESQLLSLLSHQAIEDGVYTRLEDTPIPDFLLDLVDRCPKYLHFNRQALALYELAQTEQGLSARGLVELKHISRTAFNLFSQDFSLSIEDLPHYRKSLIVTDNTMETMNPAVWRSGGFHQRIISATRHIAKRYNLTPDQYTRVLILSNPRTASEDSEWLRTLEFLITTHREKGLGFGFCLRNRIPPSYHNSCHNFYLIRDTYVGIWDAIHALAFEFSAIQEPEIVAHFSDLYDCVHESCANEDGGFFVGEMTFDEIVARLYALADITSA